VPSKKKKERREREKEREREREREKGFLKVTMHYFRINIFLLRKYISYNSLINGTVIYR